MSALGALAGIGGSTFTIMAVVEAVDRITAPFSKMDETVTKFNDTMRKAADDAGASGAQIDAGLLESASGADAMSLAEARLQAATLEAADATAKLASAETALMEAQTKAALAGEGDTEALLGLRAAAAEVAEAEKLAAKATSDLAGAQARQTGITDALRAKNTVAAESTSTFGAKASVVAATVGKVGLAMDAAGGLAVYMAAKYQSATTVLATSGGEVKGSIIEVKNGMTDLNGTMQQVDQGLLQISSSTGTATEGLVKGMYLAGSAGYTGAAGLNDMRAAAEGAKAENADLGVVTNALTTIETDYGIKAVAVAKNQSLANSVMNQMITVVQSGKTTTEELAGSLSAVLPVAAAAGLGFDQVGGAMATMTAQGTSAQQAAQDLANTIRNLQAPNNVAVQEMNAFGISSTKVQQELGKKGLSGTLEELSSTITKRMGPSGLVIQNAFMNATNAAKDAKVMIQSMPADMQKLANSYMNGSVTAKQWRTELLGLPPILQKQMQQFAATADKTHEFNSLLASGSPEAQTYTQAMSKMLGGATGLNTALQLGVNNFQTFNTNVKNVAKAAQSGKDGVSGWAEVQGTFNQKVAVARQTLDATAISIGTALLPAVTKIMDKVLAILKPIAEWAQNHQKLVEYIVGGMAALFTLVGAINLLSKGFGAVKSAVQSVGVVMKGVSKLFTMFSTSNEEAAVASEEASVAAEEESVAFEEQTVAIEELIASVEDLSLELEMMMGAMDESMAGAEGLTGATEGLDVAMDAMPIMWIVVAIALLVAGFIYCWNHFKAFRDFWKDAWKEIKGAAEVVWRWLGGVWKDISGGAERMWHDVSNFFTRLWNDITRIVGDVVTWVEGHWKLLLGILTLPIGGAILIIWQYWGTIKKFFTDGINSIVKFVKTGMDKVANFFTSLPGRILSAVVGFGTLLLSSGSKLISGLWTGVKSIWDQVDNWFKGIPKTVEGWLSDAGHWLVSVGENIINGLWSGIKNKLGGLEKDVKGAMGDVKSWAQDALSILSPSRVMADEVGKYIPLGIAQGIKDNMKSVRSAVDDMTSSTVATAQVAVKGARYMPGALPAQSLGGYGGVVNNITLDARNSQIQTERDMDLFLNKAGTALAKRILPQGGLRVNFPR